MLLIRILKKDDNYDDPFSDRDENKGNTDENKGNEIVLRQK